MFLPSFRFNMVTIYDGGSGFGMSDDGPRDSGTSERNVCNIIATKVLRFIIEDFPGVIRSVRDKLILAMDKRFRDL